MLGEGRVTLFANVAENWQYRYQSQFLVSTRIFGFERISVLCRLKNLLLFLNHLSIDDLNTKLWIKIFRAVEVLGTMLFRIFTYVTGIFNLFPVYETELNHVCW